MRWKWPNGHTGCPRKCITSVEWINLNSKLEDATPGERDGSDRMEHTGSHGCSRKCIDGAMEVCQWEHTGSHGCSSVSFEGWISLNRMDVTCNYGDDRMHW